MDQLPQLANWHQAASRSFVRLMGTELLTGLGGWGIGGTEAKWSLVQDAVSWRKVGDGLAGGGGGVQKIQQHWGQEREAPNCN